MLNKDELMLLKEHIEGMKDHNYDTDYICEFIHIYNKLSEARTKNVERINTHHRNNKELHSLNTMLSRYRKQGRQDKVAEIEERIKQVKELRDMGV